ncbi:hypothetical protein Trco_007943 [Trichoderma cornu-damae]|uniref:Uncharacterized protein n=1 Tax=Trichoderma cornu-damae TaxID=654480 RepID=A0A9P8QHU9_9HYPO|nr:hypothetical protein Trco_007943 [Trichoderma cornu-damae]
METAVAGLHSPEISPTVCKSARGQATAIMRPQLPGHGPVGSIRTTTIKAPFSSRVQLGRMPPKHHSRRWRSHQAPGVYLYLCL